MQSVKNSDTSRGNGSCGTTYGTTPPPACAKNHMTVGALNSNNDTVTGFTSWGPCDDGRLKPDGFLTHTFPFERAAEAFEIIDKHPEQIIKVGLTFET